MNRTRTTMVVPLAGMLLVLATSMTQGQSPSTGPVTPGQSPAASMMAPQMAPIGAFTVSDIVGYPPGHTFSIEVPSGTTVQSAMVTLPPGFDFGWHHHTGAVVVTVTSGSLALYDTTCARQEVTAGQGFLEELGTVHRARNEGADPVVLLVTYLGVPVGEGTDVPEAAPCEIGS